MIIVSISINAKVENQSSAQVNAIHASLVQKANYTITKFTPKLTIIIPELIAERG